MPFHKNLPTRFRVDHIDGISKRGDSYLRMLLIHGARAVVRVAHKHQDRKSRWIGELGQRRGNNVSAQESTSILPPRA